MALELLTFLGLALLMEGVLLALFPGHMRRMMEQFAALSAGHLRGLGLGLAVAAALALVGLSVFSGNGHVGGMSFAFPEVRGLIAGLF